MIQRKEMTVLLINVITAKMVLTFPKILVAHSGNAAWIQVLYSIALVLFVLFILYKLYKGKKNIIEVAYIAGGKYLRIAAGLVIFAALIINYSSIIRVFPETIKIVLLQDFNIEVITIIFCVVIGIGAYMGIESLARVNFLILPVLGGVLALFLLLLIPYYNIHNLLPILGNGPKRIFIDGFNSISLFSDLILLNIFLPFYPSLEEAKKSGRRAMYISSIVIMAIILGICLCYPYPASGEFIIPIYQLSRMMHLSSFFSRFEALFEFAWSFLVLLYSAIYVFALSYVFQKTFDLKFYKPLIFPVVIISLAIALLPESLLVMVQNEHWINTLVYPVTIGMPLIFGMLSRRYFGEKK